MSTQIDPAHENPDEAAESRRRIPTASPERKNAVRRMPGWTIDELLEWKWLFDDEEFWEAISEARGGVGICTKRNP